MIRRPNMRAAGWIVAAGLAAGLGWQVLSDRPVRLGDRALRVYDVRDLIVEVPDFPYPEAEEPDGDEGGGATREQRVRRLAEQVRTHVTPGTWRTDDLINLADDTRLLIVTSEAKHRLVQDFFDQLRAANKVQVIVEARFVSVGRDAGRELLDALDRLSNPADGGEPHGFLDDGQVTAFLRAVQASRDVEIVTAPRVTLFNGQRAYVLVENQQSYVSDVDVTRAADGSVRYVPKIDVVKPGVLLDVRATASADRRDVRLFLHPRLTQLRGMRTARVGVGPDGKPLDVQTPETWTAEVRKTVTIPAGKTLVMRGMFKPGATDGDEGEGDGQAGGDGANGVLRRAGLHRRGGGGGGAEAGRAAGSQEVVLLVKARVIDNARPAVPATGPAGVFAAPGPGGN